MGTVITKCLMYLLGILFTFSHAMGQTTFSPAHDAYVRGGANSATNYNTQQLVVKQGTVADNFRQTYLKFDLSGAGLTSADIGNAKVRLYLVAADGNFAITAHKTGDNYLGSSTPWTENGLKWDNAPGTGATISFVNTGAANTYYEWDVTNYIKEQLNGNDKVISLMLKDDGASNLSATFNNKEAASNKPQLVIQSPVNYSGTFYIDSQSGNNSNPGTLASPWKTFANVNIGSFLPGSQILLKRGGVWTEKLSPKGSGNSSNINKIGAYGSGNAPLINGGGVVLAGVSLSDQQYWDISDLEITNTNGTTGNQGEIYGIYVGAALSGMEYKHIHIKNNNIHNVNGNVGGKFTGGIFVQVTSTGQTRINDVVIEGNTVQNVGGVGIQNLSTQNSRIKTPGTDGSIYQWQGLVIRNNYINQTGRNGIIFRYSKGAIVEYNTVAFNSRYDTGHGIYNFGTDDGIVQFNEAYGNTGLGTDRGGFDADYSAYGSIIQYNYSHDNDWFCGIMRKENENVDIRYNISQNEKEYTIFYGFDTSTELKNCRIYNNTFYVGSSTTLSNVIKGSAMETKFLNNIFYYENAITMGTVEATSSFSNNLYRGVNPHSSDPFPVTGNPLLANPGSGGTHIDMTNPALLAGYKIQSGSPAIAKGKVVTNNGGRDFFNNPISASLAPSIGAHEYSSSASPAYRIEAENYNSMSGVTTTANDGGTVVNNFGSGDWIRFNNIDFSGGVNKIDVRVGSGSSLNPSLEVRLGSNTGTLLGSVSITANGWGSFQTQTINMTNISGLNDIVFVAPAGGINMNWFEYTPQAAGASTVYEVESLTTNSNKTFTLYQSTGASGGEYVALNGTVTGDYINFLIPQLASGNYQVNVGIRTKDDSGIFQLSSVAGSSGTFYDIGSPQNLYSVTQNYVDLNLGSTYFGTAGDRTFRFKLTGKDAASSGYKLRLDYIKLTSLGTSIAATNAVETKLSVQLKDEPQFKIYPNPVSNWLTVDLKNELLSSIRITDTSGKQVYRSDKEKGQVTLNASGWIDGLYIIVVENKEGIETFKFIVQH